MNRIFCLKPCDKEKLSTCPLREHAQIERDGSYMQNQVDLKVTISTEEADAMRAAFATCAYEPGGSTSYLNNVRRLAYSTFPERLLEAFERVKATTADAVGSLQVDNLPIDDSITGSPQSGETGLSYKGGVLSENILVAAGSLLGEPYSIAHEGHELVNNLTSHKQHTSEFTGLGSDVELDFHIENAAQVHMSGGDTSPFALLLLGIRNEPEGGPLTRVADARRALDQLKSEDIELLYGAPYIIRVPYRWRGAVAGGHENTGLIPILSGPRDTPRVTVAFYPDMVIAVNAGAKQALDNLYAAVRASSFGVSVVPGRLLVINNSFALHSRDRFAAQYDANDRASRWVQRVFVARSLWDFRRFNRVRDRVFDPKLGTERHPGYALQEGLA